MLGRSALIRFATFVIIGGLVMLTAHVANAAVELDSFLATPGDSQIGLDWITGSEFEAAGFYIRRSLSDDGQYDTWAQIEVVDAATGNSTLFIPASGDSFGAEYNFIDRNVQNGTSYCYALESVDINNAVEFFPPDNDRCHTPRPPTTPTYTPT